MLTKLYVTVTADVPGNERAGTQTNPLQDQKINMYQYRRSQPGAGDGYQHKNWVTTAAAMEDIARNNRTEFEQDDEDAVDVCLHGGEYRFGAAEEEVALEMIS
ncbi:hypothetical protein CBL_11082 [Carabus blaptoides fortunei]